MTPYLIEGDDLKFLLEMVNFAPFRTLRVAIDEGGLKVKFDHGTWSMALGSVDA